MRMLGWSWTWSAALVLTVASACSGGQGEENTETASVGAETATTGGTTASETTGDASTDGTSSATGTSTGTATGTSTGTTAGATTDTDTDTESSTETGTDGDEPAAGLFISRADLDRAKMRIASGDPLWETQRSLVEGRANTAMGLTADPFHMDDVLMIEFGWCGGNDDVDNTLSEATGKFEKQSDPMRTLALQYALTGDTQYADKSVELMLAWASEQTIVNLYDFNIDYAAGSFDGITEDGFCGVRPWNFTLDTMWQTYGLINVADAYLLLTRNGYALDPGDDAALRDWIGRLIAAVDSSFHAWTKWADAHPNSGSYERYRSDNHLSWALTGIIAGAAALEDDALAAYVLEGGSWTHPQGGAYANPSSIRAVIDLAIEADGRIYEEKILRDPPIGYSFFHLWAMSVVARVAAVHFEEVGDPGVWEFIGEDGGGMRQAYDRYAGFIDGSKMSPEPQQEGDLTNYRWLYETASARWQAPEHLAIIEADDRNTWINQSIGAVPLLIGVDE